jgi:hypothetical protein
MRTKKLMVLPIIVMIALAGTGIAFAHWKDQLYIQGVVAGGTCRVVIDTYEEPDCNEKYWDPVRQTLANGEYLGKDNAQCDVQVGGLVTDVHSGKSGYEWLNVVINGAYPSYRAHVTFLFHNIGTIPIWICNFVLMGYKTTKEDVVVCPLVFVRTNPGDTDLIEGKIFEDYGWDGYTGGLDDVEVINVVVQNNKFPFQLDPCNSDKGEIDFHFKQASQQCHRYYLYFYLYGVQWNKECPSLDSGIIEFDPGEFFDDLIFPIG